MPVLAAENDLEPVFVLLTETISQSLARCVQLNLAKVTAFSCQVFGSLRR
jgi:hypothetical protein